MQSVYSIAYWVSVLWEYEFKKMQLHGFHNNILRILFFKTSTLRMLSKWVLSKTYFTISSTMSSFDCELTNNWGKIELLVIHKNIWNHLTVCKKKNLQIELFVLHSRASIHLTVSSFTMLGTKWVWKSCIWRKTIWWLGSTNAGAFGKAEYLFFAIAPRSTLARSGSTWWSPSDWSNRSKLCTYAKLSCFN